MSAKNDCSVNSDVSVLIFSALKARPIISIRLAVVLTSIQASIMGCAYCAVHARRVMIQRCLVSDASVQPGNFVMERA